MDEEDMYEDNEDEFDEMKFFNDSYTELSDGAFFALAEEQHGWDVYDWAWFSDKCEEKGTYK